MNANSNNYISSTDNVSNTYSDQTENEFDGTTSEAIESNSTDDGDAIDGIGPYDVLCGRQKHAFNNVGNRRFRVTVSLTLERYLRAHTRHGKSRVILSVIDLVRENGGRFLKWHNQQGRWIELEEKSVRGKVGHALRDMATAREEAGAFAAPSVGNGTIFRNPRFFYPSQSPAVSESQPTYVEAINRTLDVTTVQLLRVDPSSDTRDEVHEPMRPHPPEDNPQERSAKDPNLRRSSRRASVLLLASEEDQAQVERDSESSLYQDLRDNELNLETGTGEILSSESGSAASAA